MKKLAMLLAVCLVATMLPGMGFALGEETRPAEEPPAVNQAGEAADASEDDGSLQVTVMPEDAEEMVGEVVLDAGEMLSPEYVAPEAQETGTDQEQPLPEEGDQEPAATDPEQPLPEEGEQTPVDSDPDQALPEDQAQETAGDVPEASQAMEQTEEPAPDGEGQEVAAPEEEQADAEQTAAGPVPHTDPNGPQLASNEVTLGVGEQFALSPAMPEGVESAITITSADPTIAEVLEDGTITAIATGDTCITATAADSTYAECFVHVKKAPDKVSFSVKSLSIGKGESTGALKVIVGSVPEECAGGYTFKSSKKSVVKVDEKGVLKGVKTGKANITVTTYNGLTATCKVTVLKAPGKITTSVDKKKLGVGETGRISYKLPKDTGCQPTFSSEDPAVVEVDAETGEMRGVSVGKTRVCARTFNDKKSYVTVTVVPAPQSLTFDVESIRLGVGMKLTARTTLDEGAAGEVTYAIQDAAVASCSGKTLKGLAKGETMVVATTYNGVTAQCPVIVVDAPKSVTLPYKTLNVAVKQSVKLEPDVGDSASTFTYSTSNKKIVTVSADGTVKGVKKGSATVTVKTYNNKKFKLKVKVVKAAKSVSVSPTKLELGVQETGKLQCSFPKDSSASVTFSSSDTDVATVDGQTGLVTGVAPGEAVITAKTHNGKKATATVTVFTTPEWVTLNEHNVELAQEQTCPLSAELSPGSRSPLYYSSADKDIATVSGDGVVTGVGVGETTITVETNVPGVQDSMTVVVLPAPQSVQLAETELTLNVGETTQMVPTIDAGTVTVFTYTTSDKAVATVSEDGNVVAVSKGSATLTVSTHNGKKAQLKLTVEDPWFPEKVTLVNPPYYLKAGKSVQLQWIAEPEGAVADLEWESANKAIAKVNSDGLLTAVSLGYVEIKATSKRNPAIKLSFTLGVETDNVTLEIPARTTSISGIAKNLEKIEAIRTSAIKQIDMLKEGGVISKSDASKRKTIINNAFKDYAFPWITLNKQKYWKKENSEGGAKDFKTGKVYYGIPYISGSGTNREYNAEKALKENRFYDSGEGYYVLNQKNLKKGKYCGNDCSCFVDAAIWGTNSKHSDDRTKDIAKSSAYKTVKDFKSMRTGDLICKGGSHVVMFLYYVNADKSKIMIIENGGIEAGTNTVHCMVMKVKWYTSRNYKIRRLKSL